MNELKSIEICSDLSKEFRLNEINKIKDYFESQIKEQEVVVKKLSKFVSSLNYTDKVLIVLSATSGGVSIISHANIIGKHLGIISSIFIVVFSLTTGVIKNY